MEVLKYRQIRNEERNQLDATQWFIELTIRSTCFGHHYAYNQELETIQIITPHLQPAITKVMCHML